MGHLWEKHALFFWEVSYEYVLINTVKKSNEQGDNMEWHKREKLKKCRIEHMLKGRI